MARAIITCSGQVIDVGDKVKTDTGRVITVAGAAVGARIRASLKDVAGRRYYNAEACTLMPKSHAATAAELVDDSHVAAAKAADDDCVVWGS